MSAVSADALLRDAAQRLAAATPTARLDAELLLSHVIDRPRTWLYTWGDRPIDDDDRARFETLLARRAAGEPVAYLTGRREFWGLALETSPHTLIPRPDTERLVEAALALAAEPAGRLLDMGTGSGAVALAFAYERPDWTVTGCDRIPEAVALAQRNALRLGIKNAHFMASDWLSDNWFSDNWFSDDWFSDDGLSDDWSLSDQCSEDQSAAPAPQRFDLMVSNPPYIAAADPHLDEGDVRFEPRSALVAGGDGLSDLRRLVMTAHRHLVPGGWLLLEHGWNQANAVCTMLKASGYGEVHCQRDLSGQPRVSLGRLPVYSKRTP